MSARLSLTAYTPELPMYNQLSGKDAQVFTDWLQRSGIVSIGGAVVNFSDRAIKLDSLFDGSLRVVLEASIGAKRPTLFAGPFVLSDIEPPMSLPGLMIYEVRGKVKS